MNKNRMIQYLVYSSLTALTIFVGSVITLAVYDVKKLPDVLDQLIQSIEGYEGDYLFSKDWNDEEFISNLQFQSQGNREEYYHFTTYELGEGQQIELETTLINANIRVESVGGNTLSIEIYTENPDRFRIETSNSAIVLKEKKKNQLFCLFGCVGSKSDIVIKVPQQVSSLELETINGDLDIEHQANLLEANTVNGTISLMNSSFAEALLEVVNGKIKVNESTVLNEANLNVVNGSVMASNLESSRIEIETVNGDMTLSNLKGDVLNLSTVNGDFNLNNIYMATIDVEKLNGELSLINEDLSYQIQLLSISGLKKNHEIQANVLKISYN